ncbi:hypothetical protein MHYP_G00085610 [Metynnis hypsauchen]
MQKLRVQQSMERYKTTMEKKALTLEQLTTAEAEIIRYSQAQCFPEEIDVLCNKNGWEKQCAEGNKKAKELKKADALALTDKEDENAIVCGNQPPPSYADSMVVPTGEDSKNPVASAPLPTDPSSSSIAPFIQIL